MEIIIVDSLFSPYGGGQKIAYDTYNILKKEGHKVFYWSMFKEPFFEQNYSYVNKYTPYYAGIKDYIKNPIKYYYNYQALKDFQSFVNEITPDVIHFHSYWGLSSAIFDVKTSAKKVLTIHDARCCPAATMMLKNKEFCKHQLCKNKNVLPCIKNRCVNNNLEASIRRSITTLIDIKKFKNINYFITPSLALKNIMLNADIGIDDNKIIHINNFLNSDEINVIPNYSNKGYFLYIGRLSREKGVHYLLEAMKDLPREIKLKIAGTGTEENKLKLYAKENNLDNVEFVGFKNKDEIREYYQNCVATILPSNCFEIFGMTNIESFINGKPVIASNIGGIPEIVEHNVNGLLFEPANVAQLKECILAYWNNPRLVIEHGKNGYEKASTIYSEKTYLLNLLKVYKN